jgi:UTP--glucose-1-phosphate uridylyltransferase
MVRKAVITAAGRGTRMFPATRVVQKELLPLIDTDGLVKPTIQIIVEECLASGIDEICIVVEKGGGGPFRAHFAPPTADERAAFSKKPELLAQAEHLGELSRRISYVEQPSPEGFGHAVFQAREFVGGEPFVLLLGDHVYTVPDGEKRVVAQLVDAYEQTGGSVTAVRHEPESDVGVTGIVKGAAKKEGGRLYGIERLQEKPSIQEVQALKTPGLPDGYYLGHFGVHLFTAGIFDALESFIAEDIRVKGEYQLTSGQERLLASGAPYHALDVSGRRWDIGMPGEYLKTLNALGSLVRGRDE